MNIFLFFFFQFFIPQPPCGGRNLWDLVLVLCDGEESSLPASYSKGIIHSKHLIKYKAVSVLLLLVQAQVFFYH